MNNASPLCMNEDSWELRMAALAGAAADADPADEVRLLHEALALLTVAPPSQAARFVEMPGLRQFEAMLACGATTSAALALLPDESGWIASRGGNGCHLASVMLDGEDEDVAAEGSTLALAVVAALAGALRHALPVAKLVAGSEAFAMQGRTGYLH